jgi:hypothetical protein
VKRSGEKIHFKKKPFQNYIIERVDSALLVIVGVVVASLQSDNANIHKKRLLEKKRSQAAACDM